MPVGHLKDVMGTTVESPEAKGAAMKVLISDKEGWNDHVMRVIELAENGYSPRHSHDWPHINYIISGSGLLHMDGTDHPVTAGSFAYVPAGALHQFQNNGDGTFQFICIVPKEGHIT